MLKRPFAVVMTVILLLAAWIVLTIGEEGYPHYQEIIAGILIALALGIFLSRMVPDGGKGSVLTRVMKYIVFLIILAKEMILANLDVAYRVLHPKMPIRPGIIKVRPGIRSDLGKLVLANSITLTPGTLTMDYIDDDLYVHWINVEGDGKEKAMEAVQPLRDRAKEVFD
ncbi:MAG: Na+/H+ antiporter subunit E [Thermoplasmatota archaeon]